MSYKDWRDDPGMTVISEYKRHFAFFPVECADSEIVWLRHYYKKFRVWGTGTLVDGYEDADYYHRDFVENITEAEYIVRKLAENL